MYVHHPFRMICYELQFVQYVRNLLTTLGIGYGEQRLVCGCSAMETHFMKLSVNGSVADVASRESLELGSECLRASGLGGPIL